MTEGATSLFALDKQSFSVCSLDDPRDERSFWLARTPAERLLAVEYLRQMAYGYDPVTDRLQRILEVARCP